MPFNIILGVIFALFILWVIKKLFTSPKLDKFADDLANPKIGGNEVDEVIDFTRKNLEALEEIEEKNRAERKALKDRNQKIKSFQEELTENSDED
jgi:cell shape-determining protein MreC